MNINFPSVDEGYLQEMVDGGYFLNKTEAVRYAVRKMREENQRESEFIAAVQVGEREVAEGKSVPYTPELLEQMERQAIENSRQGKKINPDVTP